MINFWSERLKEELLAFRREAGLVFYPKKCLSPLLMAPEDVKVLIVTDYFDVNESTNTGIPFACPVNSDQKTRVLVNLFREVRFCGYEYIDHDRSDLSGWRDQGVFLISMDLAETPRGRIGRQLSDKIIKTFAGRNDIVVVLMGKAREYAPIFPGAIEIASPDLKTDRREPYESRFAGSRLFTRINDSLQNIARRDGKKPTTINWSNT